MTWWRIALSPLLLATWGAFAAMILLLAGVGGALSRSNEMHREQAIAEAELWAENVMRRLAGGAKFDGYQLHPESDGPISVLPRGNRRFDIGIGLDRQAAEWVWYRGQVLPGALPEVFSYKSAVGTGFDNEVLAGAAAVEPASFPGLVEDDRSVRYVQSLVKQRESVARRYLPGGTDGADYVLGSGSSVDAPPGGVLEVQGNCWVVPGEPVSLRLTQDLTLLVRGNLYLGDDVVVEGVGRLLLVACADRGTLFVDTDGNGVCGRDERTLREGQLGFARREGEGAVQFGWPDAATADAQVERLRVDGAVLCWGELRAHRSARVAGPVLAGSGARGGAPVAAGADWNLSVSTEGLPGIRTDGGRRPSVLRRGRWPR